MEKVIWQPCGLRNKGEFSVLLDRGFAEEMLEVKLSKEMRHRFNYELGHETMKAFGVAIYEPFIFYEDTAFVKTFTIGQNGVSLSAHHYEIDDLVKKQRREKPITYHSHEANCAKDVRDLLVLVDLWVSRADALKEEQS